MRDIKRMISVILTALLLALPLSGVCADELPQIKFALVTATDSVRAGQSFRMNIRMEFDSDFAADSGGIVVMKWKLKFNPETLEILDPYTMQPLSFNEEGAPSNGALIRFGDIGLAGSLETRTNEEGNGIIMLYSGTSAESDIQESGDFVQLAFRPKLDLAVKDMATVAIEIADVSVSVNNHAYQFKTEGDILHMGVTPFFTVPDISAQKQNTTFVIEGRGNVAASGKTLTVDISKDGNVIASESTGVDTMLYKVEFELDEEKYPAGLYQLTFTSGDCVAARAFDILPKDEKLPDPVVPDKPDDENKGDDNKGDDNKDDDNKGDDNKGENTGDNKGDSPGSNSGNSTSSSSGSGGNKKGGSLSLDADNSNTPKDVKYPTDIASHWAEENIQYVYRYALMNGYEDNTFAPNSNITRAEFSTVIMRYLKLEENPAGADSFSDMAQHWARGAVGAMAANGIVSGVSENEFDPDAKITREQMAVILSRALALEPTSDRGVFTDESEISPWAADGVSGVAAAGLMKGDENKHFSPRANATRAEVATVIRRLHESTGA